MTDDLLATVKEVRKQGVRTIIRIDTSNPDGKMDVDDFLADVEIVEETHY